MKKQGITETIMYLLVGLVMLVGYYFLMTLYFKVSPFEGYCLIPTIYLVICFLLFPISGRKFSEAINDSLLDRVLIPQTIMIIAFVFAPFIVIFTKN